MKVGDIRSYWTDLWQSDWNGYEVGHPETHVVGLYQAKEGPHYYVDTETGEVLEIMEEDDDDG